MPDIVDFLWDSFWAYLRNQVDSDQVQIVHFTIMAEKLTISRKNTIIENALTDGSGEKYREWKEQRKLPPMYYNLNPNEQQRFRNLLCNKNFEDIMTTFYILYPYYSDIKEWIQSYHSESMDGFIFYETAKRLRRGKGLLSVRDNKRLDEFQKWQKFASEQLLGSVRAAIQTTVPEAPSNVSQKEQLALTAPDYCSESSIQASSPIHHVEKAVHSDHSIKDVPIEEWVNLFKDPLVNLNLDTDADPENVFNILLLGPSGVGKTTFINGFANYMKFSCVVNAIGQPIILTDVYFNTSTENMTTETIRISPNTGKECSFENERSKIGESRTQHPCIHNIETMDGMTKKVFRLIDTPGVQDTRGDVQNNINKENIMAVINKIGRIHAVCVLLEPNTSRLSATFSQCLDSVLVMLHRNATNNILFCYTKTRQTQFLPGDTSTTLKTYLDELEKYSGVVITPSRNNVFSFENDCFRYVCMMEKGLSSEQQFDDISESWDHNVKEMKRLISQLQEINPSKVVDIVALNNAHKMLTILANPFVTIIRDQISNEDSRTEQENELMYNKMKQTHLETNGMVLETTYAPKVLKHYRLACHGEGCVKIVYGCKQPKICHQECEVAHSSLPGDCIVFSGTHKCNSCSCDVSHHRLENFEFVKTTQAKRSDEAERSLRVCIDKMNHASNALETHLQHSACVRSEYTIMKEAWLDFAAYLKCYSAATTIDPLSSHLLTLCERETLITKGGGSRILLESLKNVLAEHEEEVNTLVNEIRNNTRKEITPQKLQNTIHRLKSMDIHGKHIAKIVEEATSEHQTTLL